MYDLYTNNVDEILTCISKVFVKSINGNAPKVLKLVPQVNQEKIDDFYSTKYIKKE